MLASLALRTSSTGRALAQETPPATPAVPQLVDTEQRLGPFSVSGQSFTVKLRKKRLVAGNQVNLGEALASLEVDDAAGNAVYQETFPYEAGDGRFARSTSASARLLSGYRGTALAIRFAEQPASTPANESWLVLGLANGKLASFGAPLPLGQDPGMAQGGVLTGVMVRGGIGVQSLASTAEAMEFRVWSGNFYVLVPVHVDWTSGKWSEGEQCFELFEGNLRPKGCNLHVEVSPQPRESDVTYAQLNATTEENRYTAQQVAIRPDSKVEFLQTRALVKWTPSGTHFAGDFSDVWLQVRVDNQRVGWIKREQVELASGI